MPRKAKDIYDGPFCQKCHQPLMNSTSSAAAEVAFDDHTDMPPRVVCVLFGFDVCDQCVRKVLNRVFHPAKWLKHGYRPDGTLWSDPTPKQHNPDDDVPH